MANIPDQVAAVQAELTADQELVNSMLERQVMPTIEGMAADQLAMQAIQKKLVKPYAKEMRADGRIVNDVLGNAVGMTGASLAQDAQTVNSYYPPDCLPGQVRNPPPPYANAINVPGCFTPASGQLPPTMPPPPGAIGSSGPAVAQPPPLSMPLTCVTTIPTDGVWMKAACYPGRGGSGFAYDGSGKAIVANPGEGYILIPSTQKAGDVATPGTIFLARLGNIIPPGSYYGPTIDWFTNFPGGYFIDDGLTGQVGANPVPNVGWQNVYFPTWTWNCPPPGPCNPSTVTPPPPPPPIDVQPPPPPTVVPLPPPPPPTTTPCPQCGCPVNITIQPSPVTVINNQDIQTIGQPPPPPGELPRFRRAWLYSDGSFRIEVDPDQFPNADKLMEPVVTLAEGQWGEDEASGYEQDAPTGEQSPPAKVPAVEEDFPTNLVASSAALISGGSGLTLSVLVPTGYIHDVIDDPDFAALAGRFS